MIEKYLERIAKNGTIPHSLLFAGPRGAGKKDAALRFAKTHLNIHNVDLHEYFPEGKAHMHSIEAIRAFIQEVSMPPFESKHKIFIIHDADRMLPTSGNALLKTFEEPSKGSIIILITEHPELLLPTILSRCTVVRFTQKGEVKQEKSKNVLKILSHGRFGTYQQLKEAAAALVEESVETLFTTILSWYRDIELLKAGGDPKFLMNPDHKEQLQSAQQKPIEEVEKALSTAKLSLDRFTSTPLVLEKLFLDLGLM